MKKLALCLFVAVILILAGCGGEQAENENGDAFAVESDSENNITNSGIEDGIIEDSIEEKINPTTEEVITTAEIPTTTEEKITEPPTTAAPITTEKLTEPATIPETIPEPTTGLTGYHEQKYDNGDKYSGNFDNGIRSGQGTYEWADGIIYIGEFVKGEPSESGEYIYPTEATTEPPPPPRQGHYTARYGPRGGAICWCGRYMSQH